MQLTQQNRICRLIREPVGHPLKIDFIRSKSLLITFNNLMIGINFTLRSMKTQEGSVSKSMNKTSPDGIYSMRSTFK
jgi:hypothetical protein